MRPRGGPSVRASSSEAVVESAVVKAQGSPADAASTGFVRSIAAAGPIATKAGAVASPGASASIRARGPSSRFVLPVSISPFEQGLSFEHAFGARAFLLADSVWARPAHLHSRVLWQTVGRLFWSRSWFAGTLKFGCYALLATQRCASRGALHHANCFAWDDPATRKAKGKGEHSTRTRMTGR